jgi:hypothetical protein
MAKPVSGKVKAATAASAIAALITTYILKGDDADLVEQLVTIAITSGSTFAAGWLARHAPKERE